MIGRAAEYTLLEKKKYLKLRTKNIYQPTNTQTYEELIFYNDNTERTKVREPNTDDQEITTKHFKHRTVTEPEVSERTGIRK